MASELLKNRALIQRLKEPEVPKVNFDLASTGFEELFTLPEPKPQELLDIQENVRIQRQQDTMNKASPFLMDESVDFIERQDFGLGGLTKEEISILKEAVKNKELTQAEFDSLQLKPDPSSSRVDDNWFGVKQRENTKLFRKVKNILQPGTASVAAKLFNNEKARNIITKAANQGKNNEEIVKLLEKANVDFGGTGVSKTNKVASTVNALIKRGSVDQKYTRTPQQLGNLSGLTDFEMKQKVKSTVEDLIKNPEKFEGKSLSQIQRETLNRPTEKGRVDVIKNEIKRQLGDKKGTKFIQDNFETTTQFAKNQIKTLLKNEKIKNLLKSKDVSLEKLEKQIAKVLKADINSNVPSNAAFRLAQAIKGESGFVDFDIPKGLTKGANAILKSADAVAFDDPFSSLRRQRQESILAKKLGQGSTFFSGVRKKIIADEFNKIKEKIGGAFSKNVDIVTDELGTIKGPYAYGSEGDSIFMQSLTKTGKEKIDNVNLEKAQTMDKKLVEIKELISESEVFPTKKVKEYNTEVKKLAKELNSNLGPNAKPIRPFIIVPNGDPRTTIANFDQIAKNNPEIAQKIINDSEKFGYSAKITKDVPTAFDLQDRSFVRKNILDNLKRFYQEFDEEKLFKKIRNQTPKQIRDIFGKGRQFLRFVETPTDDKVRYASSPNIMSDAVYVDDEPESFVERNPITTGVGATTLGTGAALTTKTGREKAKNFLSALKRLAGKGIGLGFGPTGVGALTYGFKPEEGYNLEDPLTRAGFELEAALAPSLVKGVTEVTEKIKNPFLKKIAERGSLGLMSPALATKAAKLLSVPGVASLIGEATYGSAKSIKEDAERIADIEDPELQELEFERLAEEIKGFANGGRIGFKDGPKDPSKRTFLKLMGGIASLPVVGKLFKGAKPVVEKLVNTPTKMPDWFPDFVEKFMFNSVGKKIDADLMEYKNPDVPGVTVTRSDDGRVFVEGRNEYDQPYEIQYEPPGYEVVDYETGRAVKTKGNFEAVEGRHVAVGPEDYDVEAYYPTDLDEIAAGDIRAMEKYATGKISGTIKDAMGKDTGLKKGEYDLNMAEGRAEVEADIARDLDDYYED